MIEKSKSAFEKWSDEYFVLHQIDHHAVYMFDKDVKVLWDAIEPRMELNELHSHINQLGYDLSFEEIQEFVVFFAQLAVITMDEIEEDKTVITENNQYETYIDYCCERSMPTILHVELTNACNLKCVHCFHDQKAEWLDYREIVRMIQDVKNTSFIRLTITGGEVGLYPKWKEIIEVARQNGLSVAILSNLTCFDDQDLDFIVDQKPLFVRTSLYGASAELHNAITGIVRSFDITLRNIQYLKDHGVKTSVACSVMKQNSNEIIALKQLMDKFDIPIEFGYQILPSRNDSKNVEEIMIDSATYEYLKACGILKSSTESSCNPGTYRIAIDPRGFIYACDALRVPIGNIKNESIFEALSGPEMKKIKKAIEGYLPEQCKTCANSTKCFRCPGLVWSYKPYANECSSVHCLYTKITSSRK